MRQLILYFEDARATALMRALDVFEDSKFCGLVASAWQDDDYAHLGAAAVLAVLARLTPAAHAAGAESRLDYRLVGVVVPGRDAAFLAGREVVSFGDKWATVAELCRAHRVAEAGLCWLTEGQLAAV